MITSIFGSFNDFKNWRHERQLTQTCKTKRHISVFHFGFLNLNCFFRFMLNDC